MRKLQKQRELVLHTLVTVSISVADRWLQTYIWCKRATLTRVSAWKCTDQSWRVSGNSIFLSPGASYFSSHWPVHFTMKTGSHTNSACIWTTSILQILDQRLRKRHIGKENAEKSVQSGNTTVLCPSVFFTIDPWHRTSVGQINEIWVI